MVLFHASCSFATRALYATLTQHTQWPLAGDFLVVTPSYVDRWGLRVINCWLGRVRDDDVKIYPRRMWACT